MKRQQCLDGPAMIRAPGSHGRCPLYTPPTGPRAGEAQTRLIRTEVVDRTDQIHTVPQGWCTSRQRSPSACQRGPPLTKRRVQPLDVRRVDSPVAWRAASERLDARGRPSHDAAFHLPNAMLRE
jgi:hypothetical protein